jgi:hypothetical protein
MGNTRRHRRATQRRGNRSGRDRLNKKPLSELSGYCERAALARFERDLLGQHDVSNRKAANGQETQADLGRPFSPISQTFAAAPA